MQKLGSGKQIVCIGEVLWDAMPEGLFLGGAPLNVCYHVNQLGEKGKIVSRVGDDRLGKEAVSRIQTKGLSSTYIQQDEVHETGFVEVEFKRKDNPSYNIVKPVAWDFIRYTDDLDVLVQQADVIVFGTLAQRNETSCTTIQRLCQTNTLTVCDLNLRPPYDKPEVVEQSLKLADIVKMNRAELQKLAGWFGYNGEMQAAVKQLADSFNCKRICITDGKKGAKMYNNGQWSWQPGLSVEIADTVGSGDAFLAGLITGLFTFDTDAQCLSFAGVLGAFVATKSGAMSSYTFDDIITFARKLDHPIDDLAKTGS